MKIDLLNQISLRIDPSDYLDYKVYLQSIYYFLKQHNKSYCYRTFSQDLGFGYSTLIHQIIKGHRPLSLKAVNKIIAQLKIVGPQRRYLVALVEYQNTKSTENREISFKKLIEIKNQVLPLKEDQGWLSFFSEWYHSVIYEMVEIDDFKADPEWMAKKIKPNIRPLQVKKSFKLLQSLGLIKWDNEKSTYRKTQKRVSTGHKIKGMELAKYHGEMISLAKESISQIKGKKRDISAMTVSLDEDAMNRIKEKIHQFQLEILAEAELCNKRDSIYQLNIQFFPVAQDLK